MSDLESFLLGFFVVAIILLFIWIEWAIGKLIGRNVSKLTGVILGVVLIACGFSFLTGIACIIYSQRNSEGAIDINATINQQVSSDIECPYCAETIKRNAKICRYCNNKL